MLAGSEERGGLIHCWWDCKRCISSMYGHSVFPAAFVEDSLFHLVWTFASLSNYNYLHSHLCFLFSLIDLPVFLPVSCCFHYYSHYTAWLIPKGLNILLRTYCSVIFIAALYITAWKGKRPKCPFNEEWRIETWHTYTWEFFFY